MSSTTHSTTPSQITTGFRQKYKTERCRYWYERGWCPFNEFCAFAHAELELRDKHLLNQHYKTKVCTNFKNHGFCKYGERCQFLHLQEAPIVYNRPSPPPAPIPSSYSQKCSESIDEWNQEKHQKNMNLLADFGLDILASKKPGRWQRWRWFMQESPEEYERYCCKQELLKKMDFQAVFPDYDFSRKPRLGSM